MINGAVFWLDRIGVMSGGDLMNGVANENDSGIEIRVPGTGCAQKFASGADKDARGVKAVMFPGLVINGVDIRGNSNIWGDIVLLGNRLISCAIVKRCNAITCPGCKPGDGAVPLGAVRAVNSCCRS